MASHSYWMWFCLTILCLCLGRIANVAAVKNPQMCNVQVNGPSGLAITLVSAGLAKTSNPFSTLVYDMRNFGISSIGTFSVSLQIAQEICDASTGASTSGIFGPVTSMLIGDGTGTCVLKIDSTAALGPAAFGRVILTVPRPPLVLVLESVPLSVTGGDITDKEICGAQLVDPTQCSYTSSIPSTTGTISMGRQDLSFPIIPGNPTDPSEQSIFYQVNHLDPQTMFTVNYEAAFCNAGSVSVASVANLVVNFEQSTCTLIISGAISNVFGSFRLQLQTGPFSTYPEMTAFPIGRLTTNASVPEPGICGWSTTIVTKNGKTKLTKSKKPKKLK